MEQFKNGLSGYEGYLECLAERKRRETAILRLLDIKYHIINEDFTAAKFEELYAAAE